MNPDGVVVNAGPLIALDGIGQLDLLVRLFNRVMVPATVEQELAAHSVLHAPVLSSPILVVEADRPVDPLMSEMLDSGEASVIQTALAQGCPQVLIDEQKGRKIARLYGLQVFGTARLLVEARRSGLIDSVGQALQEMKRNGYWIDEKIVRWARTSAGERHQEK